MKSVQCHLSTGLTNGLSRNGTNILSGMHQRTHVFHEVHILEGLRLDGIILSLKTSFFLYGQTLVVGVLV
jgi:hypothetical protein